MNSSQQLNENLTIFERVPEWYQDGLPNALAQRTAADVFIAAKLSTVTRQIMERYYAKLARKKKPRKPTKARGRYHWKRKEATAKRRAAARWANNPLGCLIGRGGVWNITPAQWLEHIQPIWLAYPPSILKIKRRWGYGTAEAPYTIYDINVVDVKGRVHFDGNALQLYELSSGPSARV